MLYYPLKDGEIEKIELHIEKADELIAPVVEGVEVGKIKITLANRLLFEEKLVTIKGVNELDYLDRLKEVISGW